MKTGRPARRPVTWSSWAMMVTWMSGCRWQVERDARYTLKVELIRCADRLAVRNEDRENLRKIPNDFA